MLDAGTDMKKHFSMLSRFQVQLAPHLVLLLTQFDRGFIYMLHSIRKRKFAASSKVICNRMTLVDEQGQLFDVLGA